MKITYEGICEKLGFDPVKDSCPYPVNDYEDDSQINPFDKLSDEELDFLYPFMKNIQN